MSGPGAEKLFKIIFFFGIIFGMVTIAGIFLLLIKVVLLFVPEVRILGIIMT